MKRKAVFLKRDGSFEESTFLPSSSRKVHKTMFTESPSLKDKDVFDFKLDFIDAEIQKRFSKTFLYEPFTVSITINLFFDTIACALILIFLYPLFQTALLIIEAHILLFMIETVIAYQDTNESYKNYCLKTDNNETIHPCA